MSRPVQKWLTKQAAASRKAAKQARKLRLEDPDRGVNRVPERLQVEAREPEIVKRGDLGMFAPESVPAVVANYTTRRQLGQRGHQRKPRRRELPGAVARREPEDES